MEIYPALPSGLRRFTKAFVHVIYLIEFIQTLLATHDAWDAFGGGWGVANSLNEPHWLWFSVPVLSGISKHLNFTLISLYLMTFLLLK